MTEDTQKALQAFNRVIDDFNHGIPKNRTVEDHENDIETIRKLLKHYAEKNPE